MTNSMLPGAPDAAHQSQSMWQKLLPFALLALPLGAVVLWPTRETPASVSTFAPAAATEHPSLLSAPTHAAALTHPFSPAEETPKDKGPELIREARPRMLEKHPDVAEFRWLEHKVLRSQAEQDMRREILSDTERIRNARDRLLAAHSGPLTREDELERLYRVEYLAAAIEDASNPARADALAAIEDVIVASNISAEAPIELQKSLAGDKMELYMGLLHDAPDHAKTLSRAAEGTSVERLLQYADKRYHAWTSDEMGERQ